MLLAGCISVLEVGVGADRGRLMHRMKREQMSLRENIGRVLIWLVCRFIARYEGMDTQ